MTNLKGEWKVNKDELYKKSILLIGPSGAGKSTVAQELHRCLDYV